MIAPSMLAIDRHFIKEKHEVGLICTPHVPSKQQLANLLTKGLPTKRIEDLVCKLGMVDIRVATVSSFLFWLHSLTCCACGGVIFKVIGGSC